MNILIHSHKEGADIVPSKLKDNIAEVLLQSKYQIGKVSALKVRTDILSKLKLQGWSDEFMLDANSQISLTSSLDDFVLCFQTGNVSRSYADLLKLQFVFCSGKAKGAIYIIPLKAASKKIGSNIANFERFCFEISLFKDIITVPMLVIGIY